MKFSAVTLLASLIPALAVPTASTIGPAAALPDVQGPITGGQKGYPFAAYYGNINLVGYVEEEYFLTGSATRYDVVGNLTTDGQWTLQATNPGQYKTRILVRRPKNAALFSGVAVLEWINVSFGYEISFGGDAQGLYEDGTVYILVSAQHVGVHGFDTNPQGLKQWDPVRYGTLSVPDDALSYDIYTQVARLVKSVSGQVCILGGLVPHTVVAAGGSQSGSRVLAYTNGVHPLVTVFDVTLPMLAASNAAIFSIDGTRTSPTAPQQLAITKVRTDLHIPVWEINSELEAIYTVLEGTRQPDTPQYRCWEVAGASHINEPLLKTVLHITARDGVPAPEPLNPDASQVNWLPVVDAAYRFLPAWVHSNQPPPSIPVIQSTVVNGTAVLVRAADGNVVGGVRLPELTVPVAEYIGNNNVNLDGQTIAYNDTHLARLYPTHLDYVAKVTAATLAARAQGFILDYQVALELCNANAAAVS